MTFNISTTAMPAPACPGRSRASLRPWHLRLPAHQEGRYRATLIDSEQYLLTGMRYIELNPVPAHHMAAYPADYPWSSYPYNAVGQADPLRTPHREYKRLGPTAEERQAAYRQLFRAQIP